MPYIIYHVSYIIYHISYTIYHIPYIIYHIPYAIYHIPYTIYHTPYIIYHISYTIYHIPYTIYHIPYTIYHISYTIYHIPYTIYHIGSSDPIGERGWKHSSYIPTVVTRLSGQWIAADLHYTQKQTTMSNCRTAWDSLPFYWLLDCAWWGRVTATIGGEVGIQSQLVVRYGHSRCWWRDRDTAAIGGEVGTQPL